MKKLSLLIVVMLFSMTSIFAQTSGQCGDNVSWNLTGYKLVIDGNGDMWDYWYHDLLGPKPPPWKDYVNNITEVVIMPGVSSIGSGAFHYCENLNAVTIESDVTSIGDRAFQGCTSLPVVNIPPGVTYIGYSTFEGCASLSSITIPTGITHIEMGTFAGSGLISVTIPRTVKTIGDQFMVPGQTWGAFKGCEKLASITISDGVTLIGLQTFRDCKNLTSIKYPNSLTVLSTDFEGCEKLASVFIPSGLLTIGDYRTCENLRFIQCNIKVPPRAYSFNFHSSIYGVCVLKVPTNSVALYQEADVWKDFIIQAGGYLVAPKPDNPEYGFVSGDDLYGGRATATVEAVAHEGYHFVNWTKEGVVVSTANPYSFTVTEDVELVANFAEGVGVVETERAPSLRVYPNPTTGELRMENGELRIKNVEVFDIYGRKQQTIINYQLSIINSIDISHLPTGIYFLRIDGVVAKIVKL